MEVRISTLVYVGIVAMNMIASLIGTSDEAGEERGDVVYVWTTI